MYTLIGITIMTCLIQDGATPLFIASQLGHIAVVDVLIERRASVDKPMKVCIIYVQTGA